MNPDPFTVRVNPPVPALVNAGDRAEMPGAGLSGVRIITGTADPEFEGAKSAEPRYYAMIESVPTGRLETCALAMPLFSVAVPTCALPLKKFTVPVGAVIPETGVTAALSVTGVPKVAWLGEAVT